MDGDEEDGRDKVKESRSTYHVPRAKGDLMAPSFGDAVQNPGPGPGCGRGRGRGGGERTSVTPNPPPPSFHAQGWFLR